MNKKLLTAIATVATAGYVIKNRKVIAASIEGVKAQYRMATMETEVSQATINGVDVMVQDDAILATGGLYALAGKNLFGESQIFVSNELLTAPEHVQNFVVAHEQGHIELGHLPEGQMSFGQLVEGQAKNMLRGVQGAIGQVDKRELEADAYAAEKVGVDNAIIALIDIKYAAIEKYGRTATIKEIDNRINALKYN